VLVHPVKLLSAAHHLSRRDASLPIPWHDDALIEWLASGTRAAQYPSVAAEFDDLVNDTDGTKGHDQPVVDLDSAFATLGI
jgi:hypothetical protein